MPSHFPSKAFSTSFSFPIVGPEVRSASRRNIDDVATHTPWRVTFCCEIKSELKFEPSVAFGWLYSIITGTTKKWLGTSSQLEWREKLTAAKYNRNRIVTLLCFLFLLSTEFVRRSDGFCHNVKIWLYQFEFFPFCDVLFATQIEWNERIDETWLTHGKWIKMTEIRTRESDNKSRSRGMNGISSPNDTDFLSIWAAFHQIFSAPFFF